MKKTLTASSQITFLYFKSPEVATSFFSETLGLELVEKQSFAQIYRVSKTGFIGVVWGERGFHQPQEKNAVLITLVVDDVEAWYAQIKKTNTKITRPLQQYDDIQIKCFFIEGPGGYSFEIQQFLRSDMVDVFHKNI